MLYSFEDYFLDRDRRELRRGNRLIPLQPQVFDLLEYLICNRERVVTRDDLIEAVWGGRVVSESSLSTRINAARAAIGDSGEDQRLIRTLPRKGVRFVGTVGEQPNIPQAAAIPPSAARERFTSLGLLSRDSATLDRSILVSTQKPALFVFPFRNTSGDLVSPAVADTITVSILGALSRLQDIMLAPLASTFSYREKPLDVRQVGKALAVDYVLRGGVAATAQTVRLDVALHDARNGMEIWSRRIAGPRAKFLEMQDEMVSHVSVTLGVEITATDAAQPAPGTSDVEFARHLFLLGRFVSTPSTRDSIAAGRKIYRRVVELDPGNADAFGYLAISYTAEHSNEQLKNGTLLSIAEEMTGRAIALDPQNYAGLYARCQLFRVRGRWADAIAACQTMLGIYPWSAGPWKEIGYNRLALGLCEEAIAAFETANDLEPNSDRRWTWLMGLAQACLACGRNEEALTWARQAVDAGSGAGSSLAWLAAAYELRGHHQEAEAAVAQLRQLHPAISRTSIREQGSVLLNQRLGPAFDAMRVAGLAEE